MGNESYPLRMLSQVLQTWKGEPGLVTLILGGAFPDLQGSVFDVGSDYVALEIDNSESPIRYVPYSSITEIWFVPTV